MIGGATELSPENLQEQRTQVFLVLIRKSISSLFHTSESPNYGALPRVHVLVLQV